MNTLKITPSPDDPTNALFASFEEDAACPVCRGRGCGACAWLGTAEAEELYWETKRLLVRLIDLK